MLQGLTTLGLECQAFCTAKLDLNEDVCFEKIVGDLHEPYQVRSSVCNAVGRGSSTPAANRCRSRSSGLIPPGTCNKARKRSSMQFFQELSRRLPADVLLTYGGDPVLGMIALARRRGVPVVFAIHNLAI